MNVKNEAEKVKMGKVQTIKRLEYTTKNDITECKQKLKQLKTQHAWGSHRHSRSLSIKKREQYFIKPSYQDLDFNMNQEDIETLHSRHSQGYVNEIFNKTFSKKDFLADTINDKFKTTMQIQEREWQGAFITTDINLSEEVAMLDNWLQNFRNKQLVNDGTIDDITEENLIDNLQDCKDTGGINIRMIDGIMKRGVAKPSKELEKEKLKRVMKSEKHAEKVLNWKKNLETELSAYLYEKKMKDKRSSSHNNKLANFSGISSQLEVLNNNKNILVRVVANRIIERLKVGKIRLQDIDRNNVKQLTNSMIVSFKKMSTDMNPNSGLINYDIIFKEAIELVKRDMAVQDFVPTNTIINHKLVCEKTAANQQKFEQGYLLISDQIKNIKKKCDEHQKNRMKVEIELNRWKDSRFSFNEHTAKEQYYLKRYGIGMDEADEDDISPNSSSKNNKRKKNKKMRKSISPTGLSSREFSNSHSTNKMSSISLKNKYFDTKKKQDLITNAVQLLSPGKKIPDQNNEANQILSNIASSEQALSNATPKIGIKSATSKEMRSISQESPHKTKYPKLDKTNDTTIEDQSFMDARKNLNSGSKDFGRRSMSLNDADAFEVTPNITIEDSNEKSKPNKHKYDSHDLNAINQENNQIDIGKDMNKKKHTSNEMEDKVESNILDNSDSHRKNLEENGNNFKHYNSMSFAANNNSFHQDNNKNNSSRQNTNNVETSNHIYNSNELQYNRFYINSAEAKEIGSKVLKAEVIELSNRNNAFRGSFGNDDSLQNSDKDGHKSPTLGSKKQDSVEHPLPNINNSNNENQTSFEMHSGIDINCPVKPEIISKGNLTQQGWVLDSTTQDTVPRQNTEIDYQDQEDMLDLKSLLQDIDESKVTGHNFSQLDNLIGGKFDASRYKIDEIGADELMAIDADEYKEIVLNRYKCKVDRFEIELSKRELGINKMTVQMHTLRQKKALFRTKIQQLIMKLQVDKRDIDNQNISDSAIDQEFSQMMIRNQTSTEIVFYKHYGNPFDDTQLGKTFIELENANQSKYVVSNEISKDQSKMNSNRKRSPNQTGMSFNVSDIHNCFQQKKNATTSKDEKERLDSPQTTCIRNAMLVKQGLKKTRWDFIREKMQEKRKAEQPPLDPNEREEWQRKQMWKQVLKKKTYNSVLDHASDIGVNASAKIDGVLKEMVDKHVKQNIWKPVVTYDTMNAVKEVRYKKISRKKAKEIEISQNLIDESKSRVSVDIDSRIEALSRSQSKMMTGNAFASIVKDGYMLLDPKEQAKNVPQQSITNILAYGFGRKGTEVLDQQSNALKANTADRTQGNNIFIAEYGDINRHPGFATGSFNNNLNDTLANGKKINISFEQPKRHTRVLDHTDILRRKRMIKSKNGVLRRGSLSPPPQKSDDNRRVSIASPTKIKQMPSLVSIMTGQQPQKNKNENLPGGYLAGITDINKKMQKINQRSRDNIHKTLTNATELPLTNSSLHQEIVADGNLQDNYVRNEKNMTNNNVRLESITLDSKEFNSPSKRNNLYSNSIPTNEIKNPSRDIEDSPLSNNDRKLDIKSKTIEYPGNQSHYRTDAIKKINHSNDSGKDHKSEHGSLEIKAVNNNSLKSTGKTSPKSYGDNEIIFPGYDVGRDQNNTLQVLGEDNVKRLSIDLNDSEQDMETRKEIKKPREILPELKTNADILAYERNMIKTRKKEKEEQKKIQRQQALDQMAKIEEEEQIQAYEDNMNNMQYIQHLQNKGDKKSGALLYDIEASENNSRTTGKKSVCGSTRSANKKKTRLEDVKNPVEKLTIMIERVKNSKATNEDYRKKIIERQQARQFNMKFSLEREEVEKETEIQLQEQREASQDINRKERKLKKKKECEAKGIPYEESEEEPQPQKTEVEPHSININTSEKSSKKNSRTNLNRRTSKITSESSLNNQSGRIKTGGNDYIKISDAKKQSKGKAT